MRWREERRSGTRPPYRRPLDNPSLTALLTLDDPCGGENMDDPGPPPDKIEDPGLDPPQERPKVAWASMFGVPASSNASLTTSRRNPTKERLLRYMREKANPVSELGEHGPTLHNLMRGIQHRGPGVHGRCGCGSSSSFFSAAGVVKMAAKEGWSKMRAVFLVVCPGRGGSLETSNTCGHVTTKANYVVSTAVSPLLSVTSTPPLDDPSRRPPHANSRPESPKIKADISDGSNTKAGVALSR